MSLKDLPKLDEIEVSVIGPGRGESIVLHLGDNRWAVVDSCLAAGSKEPAALTYLRQLDSKLPERIELLVATHWHDDHIRGLASILEAAPNARFVCSQALHSKQFFQLVSLGKQAVTGTTGVDEFGKIVDILSARKKPTVPQTYVTPIWAIESRRLLHFQASFGDRVEVISLSPSDGLIKRVFQDIADWIPAVGEQQRVFRDREQNDTSVALWIEVGTRRILLGADLEVKSHAGEGWAAAISGFQGQTPAAVYKVAHHGSPNADSDDIWSKFLSGNTFSVLTPFTGGAGRPQIADLERIRKRTENVFLTASGSQRPPKRDNTVEKQISHVKRRVLQFTPGQVRLRWQANADKPNVELFHGSSQIS